MEGINPQRMAMIANTPAPANQPTTTITSAPTWTESNNIPLGAPRRGPRLDQATADSSHAATSSSPPHNNMAMTADTDPYNETMVGAGMEDDEMDDEMYDQNETTFTLDRSAAHGADTTGSDSIQSLPSASYYQPSEPFSGFGTQELWQPPADDPNFVLRNYRVQDPIRCFHSACMKIRRNWDCAPSQCLPAELNRTTPYSLVMLRKLALLSTATPKACRGVQELLFAQAANRVSHLPMPAHNSPDLKIVRSPGQKDAENWILENLEGLMLDDVDKVLCELRKGSVSRLPVGPNASETVMSLLQESVNTKARKEARRVNRKANRQQQKSELKAAGLARPSKKERIIFHRQRWEAARDREAKGIDSQRMQLQTREDDALLQQLTRLGVDRASLAGAHRKDRQQRRKAALQHGLPYERLQNAPLPSLHLLAAERNERAAIQGISSLGLGAQQPLPSLAPEGATEDTDEDEGGVSLLDPGNVSIAQGDIRSMGSEDQSVGAPQDGPAIGRGPRRAPGTRCPECFRLHRKCTHTETPSGAGDDEQQAKVPTKGYSHPNGGRSKGRGGYVEHVGPRHGEVVGADAAAMDANNRGQRMMEKMGWSQGTALGKDGEGVLAPLEQRMRQGKAGLG